jgi:hypothetical protein
VNLQTGARHAHGGRQEQHLCAGADRCERLRLPRLSGPRRLQACALAAESGKGLGQGDLQAVEFAFYVLNEKYGTLAKDNKSHLIALSPKNTITIASSISNGAGAALLAAEQDSKG